MSTPTILTVAPTGAWPTKEMTPYVPLQPEEIAREVIECAAAGASIAHIHVRDDDGRPSMDFAKFEQAVELIRAETDIVLNLTTSGGLGFSDDERMKPFQELHPEIASFDAGSMNWMHTDVFVNSPTFLENLGRSMSEHNVRPEIEIFDSGMLYNALHYIDTGTLQAPAHFQFVLGVAGGIGATVPNLVHLVNLLPEGSTWSAFGIGRAHLSIMYAALAMGGHVRVGMEDNIYYGPGKLATSNAQFVRRTLRVVEELGGRVATPAEARELLRLRS